MGSHRPSVTDLVAAAGGRRPTVAVGTLRHGRREVHLAGERPFAPDTLFQIGSITKVFTATCLAAAATRGEVDLDGPVADLLPGWRWPPGRPITLRELATHTSGLPRIPPSLWRKVLTRDQDPYADVDAETLRAEVARSRLHGRGRRRYSNFGSGLLGHALATDAGTSWAELVRREVTAPLGMVDTVAELPPERAPRAATGHRRNGRPRPVVWHFADAVAGCGALWSTPNDMLAFLEGQLAPPAGVLGDAVRLARRDGLGWFEGPTVSGSPSWLHNGGTYGFRSIALLAPDLDSAVVALSGSDRGVDALGLQVLTALVADGRPHEHPGA